MIPVTHIKWDGIDSNQYECIKKSEEPYFCKICKEDIFPFQQLSDEQSNSLPSNKGWSSLRWHSNSNKSQNENVI